MIIDPSVLARWQADDLVPRLVEMFAEDAPRLAREVIAGKARSAHTLRGCALNVGAEDLARAAGAIERGETSPLATLEALTAETVSALRHYCTAMQRAPLAFTVIK